MRNSLAAVLTLTVLLIGTALPAQQGTVTAIRAARKALPEKYKERIEYRVGNAEHVKQKAAQFDIVVFSWVL